MNTSTQHTGTQKSPEQLVHFRGHLHAHPEVPGQEAQTAAVVANALHNLSGYPSHKILLEAGAFAPAVKSIIIQSHERTAHAAESEKGLNPDYDFPDKLIPTGINVFIGIVR